MDDEALLQLAQRLHQEVRNGADPMTALRRAQLAGLAAAEAAGDWNWAAFQLIGGAEARSGRRGWPFAPNGGGMSQAVVERWADSLLR